MFSFLKTKKNYFLGIDFGTSSIKIVELAYDKQVRLTNYGFVDFSNGENSGEINYENRKEKLVKYLRVLLEEMKVKSDTIYTAIPGSSGLAVTVNFPDLSDEELAKAIKLEAGKHIPSPLEEVYLSWDVVSRSRKKTGIFDRAKIKSPKKEETAPIPTPAPTPGTEMEKDMMEVMLVAAPKEEVIFYEDIVRESGYKVKSLELDIFSTVRALVGEDLGAYLIIDIGSRVTNIILVDKGIVRMNRSLSSGGSEVTNVIKSSMNVVWSRAENFKKQPHDFFGGRESVDITQVFSPIINESKRMMDEYAKRKKRQGESVVDSVILSGGTAVMANVDTYFAKALGLKVTTSNPWRRVKEINPALKDRIKDIGPSFSVAIGLALKGVDDYFREA